MKPATTFLLYGVSLSLFVGCSQPSEPVDRAIAQSIQSGTPLSEVEKKLGPPATPTSKQMAALRRTFDRMPDAIRDNAESDRALAWGNDKAFLAVVVNEEGTIWVTSTHFGSGSPQGPPEALRRAREERANSNQGGDGG
jgi:hypothetical protein